jgi:hypothetical protein
MTQITASPADRAEVASVLAELGPVAVVRMVPVTLDDDPKCDVLLFDASGVTLHEHIGAEGHKIARDTVRTAFPGQVWTNNAYDYHAGTGLLTVVVALRVPPREVRPLADRDAPEGWRPNGGHNSDCAYVGGIGPNCSCCPAHADTLDLSAPVADDTTAGGAW